MGRAKPLIPVAGIPLVVRVVRAALEAADEIVVVTKGMRAPAIRAVLPDGVALRRDSRKIQSPLVGFVAAAVDLPSVTGTCLPFRLPLLSPTSSSTPVWASPGRG